MSARPFFLLLIAGALMLSVCPTARALLVDWDTLTWTPGALTNSYNIDPNAPGNDVTITVGAKKGAFDSDATTGILTPNIGTAITGGLSPVQKSFELAANLYTTSNITLTVNFNPLYNQGSYVSFTIFDIDLGTNSDRIQGIYGLAPDGTHIAATITNVGTAASLSGSGLNQVITGNSASFNSGAGSGNGNATISFASPVTGFAFVFANNAGAPRYQDIAIGDIFFFPIPEMDPAIPALFLCVGVAIVAHLRKRRV